MRRVVISGIGVVAPNGVGREAFWNGCVDGHSGVGPIRSFDPSNHPIKIAGEVHDFDPEPYLPAKFRKSVKVMGRAARFGVGAAGLAVADSGLAPDNMDPERLGVVMGAGLIPMDLGELAPMLARACQETGEFDPSRLADPDRADSPLFPLWLLKYLPNMAAAHISMAYNCQGPNNTVVTACVAGTQAVGEAYRLVSRGDADVMLAGGADSRIDPLMLLAYTALGTLSKQTNLAPEARSRPFDRLRDGFVISEGAAVLVLEEYERAKARNAPIYAEVLGWGSTFDAYSVTKPDPDGRGGARAIQSALTEAQVDHRDIGYINAHGTSTKLNDAMETAAVKRVFGDRAKTVQLSSIKSMIGHSIGASGAIEAAALALSLHTQVYPPTINLTNPDPACDLDYIPNTAREGKVRYGLSTSFGFGGQNGALVMAAV
ncbi:3-oxoacyl-acp synthase : 3-oxoacyl-(Acyl-carrier-protein) synthase OS=Singulisphaera acidiphila (strain ATCC BAA-1392 / DSM 18658 / VKM B-2454 / MOB10) GN=Sinac_1387 PE=3 SV=1: ketoacyl-synt: Ketoacyl-synt_C [Gemmataceae bacterium]|nr:3-oxoacyl-acp synthase : 3-oxoacyl-(Acyl-carrier-protein) synthase OS=Singulisphaera acidiphila (strain ATCC BAA-1392 / DSM 18658 / VKM B-2454 / MOB10) GN=Sinac_1387 PE=3 SV=1: ketoacyl-synt: Ketoacyl-synt_C [Gemmataceae bacterium]VTU02226.1 3-oxoacyl-acp synthase : 3-oxoacyl-(Acyl-carrier-protein) synthase OS=Singulisphaera acidiphila (strain ATCC BAA-1392 / DSM 18658 / VKM B-2454 / MOB10) GN=Sinac_1387 PE=3 SV=1: ketoacyl-synt: Ketoacyl-synt_C [Gemmataceae bacterium]